MKQLILVIIIIVFTGAVLSGCGGKNTGTAQPNNVASENAAKNMKLMSPVFNDGDYIPAKYTCDGDPPAGGINPPLEISGAPDDAKSLALIVDDPDSPSGDWAHWIVWNITPDIKSIAENSVPAGAVQGVTDFGSNKYGGPCPPSGTHRYQFKLYALDTILNPGNSAAKRDIENSMNGHILDQAILVGLYEKS